MHFELFADTALPAAIERYRDLTEAAFSVLDQRLATRTWLAGEHYSIADIAHFGWSHIARLVGFDCSHHRHLDAWHQRVAARPAVQRGIVIPAPATGA